VISCVAGWVGAKNTSIQEHQQRGLDVICNKRVAPHGTAILNTISILRGIKLSPDQKQQELITVYVLIQNGCRRTRQQSTHVNLDQFQIVVDGKRFDM